MSGRVVGVGFFLGVMVVLTGVMVVGDFFLNFCACF